MFRPFLCSLSCLLLGACVGVPGWLPVPGDAPEFPADPADAATGAYRFDWRLSGSRAVAPLQVFDDGRRTWLQFPAGQPWPALFAVSAAGERLLQPRRQGDFAVLDGVWPRLRLRGGHLESQVEQWPAAPAGPPSAGPAVPVPVLVEGEGGAMPPSLAGPVAKSQIGPASAAAGLASPAAGSDTAPLAPVPTSAPAARKTERPAVPRPAASRKGAATTATTTASATTASTGPEAEPGSYAVRLQDGTLRAVLGRWAQASGWLFTGAHWAVDADIPLMGEARFDPPFEQAVRALIGSTALSALPLRPCFYSNRVLRIVPAAQACDRSASPERGA